MSDVSYLIVHKDHPIKVLGVNSGAETATLWLARTLARRGNRVVMCAQLADGERTDQGVEFWDLGKDYDVESALIRAREIGPYHLIAACRAQAIIQSRREQNCLSRTFMAHDPSAAAAGIQPEILCRIADNVVCVSNAQRDLFLRTNADPQKVSVIANGADLNLFKPGDPEKRNYKNLVYVGALVVDKGIHLLINAFAKLRAKHPDCTLDVYGSASMWGREELFDSKAIEQQVPGLKFHGAVPQQQVSQIFQRAGAVIIPSIYFDSFPLTAVEAQVTGCPVVGFDAGGIRDAIIDGTTGALVKEVSDVALFTSLDALLSETGRLKKMAIAAEHHARSRFSWDIAVEQLEALIHKSKKNTTQPTVNTGRFGFLTTWNQECGLATYGRYLLSGFDTGSYVVLAEETSAPRTAPDEDYVERCWARDRADFGALERAIEKYSLKLLHLNCHYRFFPQPAFADFLKGIRSRGVKVVAHVHNPYTIDPQFAALASAVDKVIVHTPENRLEAIANGAHAEDVVVIPHGVHSRPRPTDAARQALRQRLGFPEKETIVACFGFVQAHKGVESLIDGIAHLTSRGITARGVVVGRTMPGDPQGAQYLAELKRFAAQKGVAEKVQFLERFVTNAEVEEYLQAADIALLNYRSQYYEASGAGALALGSGTPVVTSIAPPFAPFSDAVWHATSGFPVPLALEVLCTQPAVRAELQRNAAHYCALNSWTVTAQRIRAVYNDLCFKPTQEKVVAPSPSDSKKLRVLMQNRPTTFTHRGGDSVVVEKLRDGLIKRGVDVVVDLEGTQDIKAFDLVHLFNFATPELTKSFAERAKRAGKPFVVTTLCEDVEHFHNQALVAGRTLVDYVRQGQNGDWWMQNKGAINKATPAPSFDNRWVVENAAALYPNGSGEAAVIRRIYGAVKNLKEVRLGYEVGAKGDPALFEREFKVRDFVLCVGRLETRKNQLMLLKALEKSDLTVVIAGGGFSYQPEYEQAVRNFKRAGKTIVLGRLSPEMLASAYAACKIHVLPSWYELPGLVSLEAASAGKNVVVTDRGTARDYLGDSAFYCDPSDESSVLNAVLAAYYCPVKPGIQEAACSHRWDNTVEETLMSYQTIMGIGTQTTAIAPTTPEANADFERLLTEGEEAAKNRNYDQALAKLAEAERMHNNSSRLFRARAAVYLAQGRHIEARPWFGQALTYNSRDAKALCGIGMCEMMNNEITQAYDRFYQATLIESDNLVAIKQLLDCAYRLNRYDDLERALRTFLAAHPNDLEMKYCLAGCLYKTARMTEAESVCAEILSKNPSHFAANQLRTMIRDGASAAMPSQPAPAAATAPTAARVAAPVTAAAPVAPVSQPRMPSRLEMELVEVEDLKRARNVEEARAKLASVQTSPLLSAELRERATILDAELMVLEGKLSDAENVYRGVLEKNPNSPRALCGQGALLAHASNWDEAKRRFTRALELSPTYDVALAGLGMCAAVAKSYYEAWSYYMRSLESNVENKRALLGLMEIGYAEKRFPEIEQAIRRYLDLHPADLNFMYSLAGCLYAQERLDEARSEIEKVILFDPAHSKALELKGYIDQRQSGRAPQMAHGS